ncbi:hypothetical protein [Formosa sp. A9]|uniref:hypothetical protein n=1 Tax=Formosa sp. A9 TaxID=3442641 RepID=UPI003EB84135
MKSRILIISLLLLSSIISSCSSDDGFNYQSDFENSRNAWLNFKSSSNNSYKYTVNGGSVFTTYGWETTITVSKGVIIGRAFRYTNGAEDFIPVDQLEWTENENEINSLEHEHTSAFTAVTLDAIYIKAEYEWLIKRDNANSVFKSDNDGMISACGYYFNDCQDDCFHGVHIKTIETL